MADNQLIADTNRMKWIGRHVALLLMRCSPAGHIIQVDVESGDTPASAVVSVCGGPEQPLVREGTRFTGAPPHLFGLVEPVLQRML